MTLAMDGTYIQQSLQGFKDDINSNSYTRQQHKFYSVCNVIQVDF